MGLPSLDITGIGEHTARLCGEAGSGGVFPFVTCLCGNMEERHFFENQQTSTFVTFVPRHGMPGRPESDWHSVMSNDEKVFCSPLNPLTVHGGNVMTEVESTPASTKKRTIMLWPSVVALALLFAFWVFFYDDELLLLIWVGIQFFGAVSLVWLVCLIVSRRLNRSLSFLIPILLAASLEGWFIPAPLMSLISTAFTDSRDYVEFLIYDAKHHIRAEVSNTKPEYKKWHLYKPSGTDFSIVYDVTEKTLKEDGTGEGRCYSEILSLGDDFYFVRVTCPGFFRIR